MSRDDLVRSELVLVFNAPHFGMIIPTNSFFSGLKPPNQPNLVNLLKQQTWGMTVMQARIGGYSSFKKSYVQ
jgi:hypothetical protein